ncbi:MAG: redox-sensing transcriptional repressor Rex [Ignavibacteriales bacterium]|nr:redox-sensing transcriptional repressor Rex [Ignavibacteriales bacterium]
MAAKEIKHVPEPVLRRLPRYLQILTRLKEEGLKEVSSTRIANELHLDSTQVRKDIEFTGIIGKPKTGFLVPQLIHAIESFLNWDNVTDAFLVGAGSLGTAILGYPGFNNYGINIIAAFDSNPEKGGGTIRNIPIFHIDKLPDLSNRMHVHIGIITVPAASANEVAAKMIDGGIKAIWNFAPVQLRVPKEIIVENVLLHASLSVLTRKLGQQIKDQK